jgi:dipeptidyl-peptidase-4
MAMYVRLLLATATLFASVAFAQDRIRATPEYQRYAKMRSEITASVVRGDVSVEWLEGGKSFQYQMGGKNYRFDLAEGKASEAPRETLRPEPGSARNPGPRAMPQRGRQFLEYASPDGKTKAIYRDRNVWLVAEGGAEKAITTDGDEAKRIKNGSASWVYGEELGVREAMWWSPDGKYLAYYRFDESPVKDFYLTMGLTGVNSSLDIEPYPKAGADNPIVELFIYDVERGASRQVDIRNGNPFENHVVGYYAYSVRWSPSGKELLFNRTNRRQNIMEFCAADPITGKVRVIIREEQPESWTTNSPSITWIDDSEFIWVSERNGFANFYRYDISGKLIAVLTNHQFEVANIVRLDRQRSRLFYMARSGDNPYKMQFHVVGLDGKGDKRLTDPAFHHTVNLSPDGQHFVDTAETHSVPPVTRVVDLNGTILETLNESDMSKFESMGLQKAEVITFTAADGKTVCYGMLMKPSDFDPNEKYPLIVSVYAGPESGSMTERFRTPDPLTEMGVLVAFFDGRGTRGRGKKFKDEMYMKLGVTEVDDQAAGVRELLKRPYVDPTKVGIHGTSYGGYASALAILRYPDIFTAAVASSSVTDWRHYDTIYTERYNWIPQENEEGYRLGSCMNYVNNLKGDLMLFFGTADNNVHPNNTMQLAQALQRAGKTFYMQAGPDQGHVGFGVERTLEFFWGSFSRVR